MELIETLAEQMKLDRASVADLMRRFPYWVTVRDDALEYSSRRPKGAILESLLDEILLDHLATSNDWFVYKRILMFQDPNYALKIKLKWG